jgi:hypothetical protein
MATANQVSMALPPEYIQQRTQELLNTYFGTPNLDPSDPNYVPGLVTQPRTVPAQEAVALSGPQQQLIQAANTAATSITPQSLGIGSFDPFLQQALAQTQQGQQTLQDATGIFNPSDATSGVSAFMSPYQQNVTQEALKEIDRQGAIAQNQAAASAIGAGAFGGGREGVQRAELGRNIQDIKSKRIAEDLQSNYLQALSTAQAAQEGQRQRQLYAGSQMGSMGQRTAALGLSGQQATGRDIATLSGIGAIDVTQRQAEQEAMRQNILAAQEEPFSRLNFGAGLLAGVPQSTTTLTQAQQPNPYLTALQTGILGLGVLSGQGGNLGSFLS